MEFKGSKTETNLRTAFSGESQARSKYIYYAEKAREENRNNVADFFETAARNEQEHAKIWFELFNGIGSSELNLQDAIKGEHYESTEMYVNFSKIAREEGFIEIALLFDSVASIEKKHEEKFISFLENKNSITENWCCKKCGYVHNKQEAPNRCPVCEQYRVGGTN